MNRFAETIIESSGRRLETEMKGMTSWRRHYYAVLLLAMMVLSGVALTLERREARLTEEMRQSVDETVGCVHELSQVTSHLAR